MNLNEIIIKKVSDAFIVNQRNGNKREIANRPCYALSFCKQGKITYSHNGKTYVSTPTSVIFHPQGQTYFLSCSKSGDFPLINFEIEGEPITQFYQFDIPSVSPFLPLFEKLVENAVLPNRTAKNFSILYEIFSMLSESVSTPESVRLAPAIDTIYKEFTSPYLSVSNLASLSHVSECYFRRLFSKVYGVSPKQYVCSMRIKYAKQLLNDGKKTITEVAIESGFSSVYYFSKAFKESEKITPSQYCKNCAKLNL